MSNNYEVTFFCSIDEKTRHGISIYIDGREIPDSNRGSLSEFTLKSSCQPGKHSLSVVQKSAVASKFWWLSIFLELLMLLFGMSDDRGFGPYYAVAEGELNIDGDAEVFIGLKDTDVHKLKKQRLKACRFNIAALRNCCWTERTNRITTTPGHKKRWLVTAITPVSVVFCFLLWLFSALGVQAFSKNEIFWGTFCLLLAALTLCGFIIIVYHIIKVAGPLREKLDI